MSPHRTVALPVCSTSRKQAFSVSLKANININANPTKKVPWLQPWFLGYGLTMVNRMVAHGKTIANHMVEPW